MAFGLHWEWRGFGGIDSKFAERYSKLNKVISEYSVVDCYLYAPGLETNIKIRKGAENGLKFKRPGKVMGNYEQWLEDENEIFDFPLSKKAQKLLMESFKSTELNYKGSFPRRISNEEHTISWLKDIGCRVIEVQKKREIRKWISPEGSVLIEWTCLFKPQPIISVSLESGSFDNPESQIALEYLDILKSAYQDFGLNEKPLCTMNYLEAVAIWAKSNKI